MTSRRSRRTFKNFGLERRQKVIQVLAWNRTTTEDREVSQGTMWSRRPVAASLLSGLVIKVRGETNQEMCE